MSLLEVTGLTAGYGPLRVLYGLDLHVDEGEVVVILGANGAGKTTAMRALSGMIPARGRITLGNQAIAGRPAETVARLGVAHVPQGRGTFADLSVRDNLRLGAYTRRAAESAADIDRWYNFFPRLRDREGVPAGSLSGGEQQMLAIARALMLRPRLLLLDEPSLGLAPIVTRELFEVLGRLNRDEGMTVLMVEQNAALGLDLADRAYLLETGHVVAEGPADELRGDAAVRRAYLGY